MVGKRVRRELQRQPRWWPWVMLASAACTFVSLVGGDPSRRLGGPVLYFVVLGGSGAMVALSIALLVFRARQRKVAPPEPDRRGPSPNGGPAFSDRRRRGFHDQANKPSAMDEPDT